METFEKFFLTTKRERQQTSLTNFHPALLTADPISGQGGSFVLYKAVQQRSDSTGSTDTVHLLHLLLLGIK